MPGDPLAVCVAALAAAYPRQAVTRDTVAVYVRSLRDLPVDHVEAATRTLMNDSVYFPTIAEIRQVVLERVHPLPQPEEAWEQVMVWLAARGRRQPCPTCEGRVADDVCATCGDEGTVPVERQPLDQVVQRALDNVGGIAAYLDTDEPGIVRAQFVKTYAAFRRDARRVENQSSAGLLASGERPMLDRAEVTS